MNEKADSFTRARLAKALREAEGIAGIHPRTSKQSILLPEGMAIKIAKILEEEA